MGFSRKLQATKYPELRRIDLDKNEPAPFPRDPRERMRIHQESKAHRGPGGTTTVRVTMRAKHTYDGAAKLIRSMYDSAEKPKRRRRRGQKSPTRG